jgi:hypothetical protein
VVAANEVHWIEGTANLGVRICSSCEQQRPDVEMVLQMYTKQPADSALPHVSLWPSLWRQGGHCHLAISVAMGNLFLHMAAPALEQALAKGLSCK